jgi:hypothetical protein
MMTIQQTQHRLHVQEKMKKKKDAVKKKRKRPKISRESESVQHA